MATFIKATLVPNHNPPAGYQSREIILSTSAITAISQRQNNEYELILTPQAFQQLQDKYWKGLTTLKEVTAIIKDTSILL